jgi:hypothetical protein
METFSTNRRDGFQRLHDLPRDPCVIVHARANIDGLWRQAAHRLGNRHGRVNAIPSRLVGASRNDATLAGLGADDHRQSTPIRMVALLDRRVESVEVDVVARHPMDQCESPYR